MFSLSVYFSEILKKYTIVKIKIVKKSEIYIINDILLLKIFYKTLIIYDYLFKKYKNRKKNIF